MKKPRVSPVTLNRISIYLRCLRQLQQEGVGTISSKELAKRYHLSASQIRKDLDQFGEFGIRGVGYRVDLLVDRLTDLLGLDTQRRIIVIGMGNLGLAVTRHFDAQRKSFRVVAAVDTDPELVGREIDGFVVRSARELKEAVEESAAELGVLAVPAPFAQESYDRLVDAGVHAVLNFAPVNLRLDPAVPAKNVDLRIYLEELGFFLTQEERRKPESSP